MICGVHSLTNDGPKLMSVKLQSTPILFYKFLNTVTGDLST